MPKVKHCKPNEKIHVNPKFKSKILSINFVPKKTHKKRDPNAVSESQEQILQEIKIERQHVLDALVVRIMKARKKEQHQSLMTQVINEVKLFKPQPAMIKESFDRLIEKEYLERDPKDRTVYIYIP